MRIAAVMVAAGLFLLAPGPSESQMDLSATLVGTWEGEFRPLAGGYQSRVLLIESVRQQDSGWAVTAKFGPSEQSLFPVNVALEVSGAEVRVRFRAGAGGISEANLTLRGKERLVGTFTILTGRGLNEVRMTLSNAK